MYTLEDLQNAIAVLTSVDLEDPDIDQVDELIINAAEKVKSVDKVLDTHEAGSITIEEAQVQIAEIITESAEADLDVFDLEIDLEQTEEMENYAAAQNETISFSQALGGTIGSLIEAEYNSTNEGVRAIATSTGLDDGTISSMIKGEVVPDQQTANNIAACFSVTSAGAGHQEFMNLSNQALSEVAQFSNPPVSTVEPRMNRIEAEFSQYREENELKEVLRTLNKKADGLVNQGKMTPHEKTLLFGKYQDDADGLALFSGACQANNVPVETQVDRIRSVLNFSAKRNADARFGNDRHDDYILEAQDDGSFIEEHIARNGII